MQKNISIQQQKVVAYYETNKIRSNCLISNFSQKYKRNLFNFSSGEVKDTHRSITLFQVPTAIYSFFLKKKMWHTKICIISNDQNYTGM